MSNNQKGQHNQVSGHQGTDAREAAQKAHDLLLTAAKNSTAIAFIDNVNLAGQNWLKGLGMYIDFTNRAVVEASRLVMWNGTPHMGATDLSECLALLRDYNAFEPARVVLALRTLKFRYPKMGFEFRLAREFSPVVYVREVQYTRLSDKEIKRIASDMLADEAYVGLGGEIGFWFI